MDIRKAAEDAARRVAELHAAHAAAVAEQEAMGDAEDPLDYERAHGRVRQSLFRLRRAGEKAAQLRECARLAASVPPELNGQRFVYDSRSGGIFPYTTAMYSRVFGSDYHNAGRAEPDESSLLLLTAEDARAIHAGEWESLSGQTWKDRVLGQYRQGRDERLEARRAESRRLKEAAKTNAVSALPIVDYDPEPPQVGPDGELAVNAYDTAVGA